MKLSKRQRIIAASVAGALIVGLGGFGFWQWNQESTAANAYAQADGDMRAANGDRNRSAASLNQARADALAAHAGGVQLSGMADPTLLETPTLRDDVTAATTTLAEVAGLEPNDAGALVVPAAVITTRAPPSGGACGAGGQTCYRRKG